MELHPIYFQPGTVQASIDTFVENLVEAVVIVVALLLVFMGLRSGLLIGAILVLTILATFVVMWLFAIDLHSISLGALVIALGMLVDAAIVVVDGILIRSQMGETREEAAQGIVGQTQWPLLGATVIAIIAFAPVGLSPDSTGEYCKSLFQVVGISLLLSWALAVTITPVAGAAFLQTTTLPEGQNPFGSPTYQGYRRLLEFCLTHRSTALITLGALLVLAAVGFTHVAPGFSQRHEPHVHRGLLAPRALLWNRRAKTRNAWRPLSSARMRPSRWRITREKEPCAFCSPSPPPSR